jgi:hypothetical protein
MSIRAKQSQFMHMVALLILHAEQLGYELTGGELERKPQATWGHPKSCHKLRLAIDLNLFKDGVYLSKTEDHLALGEYWESIGGAWGGRFNDGNHYSLEHKGVR